MDQPAPKSEPACFNYGMPTPAVALCPVSDSEIPLLTCLGCRTVDETVTLPPPVFTPELTQVRPCGIAAAHNPKPYRGSVSDPETPIIITRLAGCRTADETVVQFPVVIPEPTQVRCSGFTAAHNPKPNRGSVSDPKTPVTAAYNNGRRTMDETIIQPSPIFKPELTQFRNSGIAATHYSNPNCGFVTDPESLMIMAYNDGLRVLDESVVVESSAVKAEPIQVKNGRTDPIPIPDPNPNPNPDLGSADNPETLILAYNDGLALDESVVQSSAVNSEPIQVKNGEINSIPIPSLNPNPNPNPGHGSVTHKGPTSAPKETLGRPHRHRLKENRSSSTDIDRDQAWERKRQVFMMEYDDCEASFPDSRPWARQSDPIARTRSLTDEHMEELSGFIDLGFRFSLDEKALDLSDTLPALELYYAVNRHLKDVQLRSSPVSTLQRTSSSDSFCESPLGDSWKISNPGDHPNQVKMRLRHWAKVVACSVKQLL